jgi:hypothetical protein
MVQAARVKPCPWMLELGGYFTRTDTYYLRWRGDIRATFFSANVTFFALIEEGKMDMRAIGNRGIGT